MAIHIRVVTPITTEGFRTAEDAIGLQSEGVTVDFVNIDAGPASIDATSRSCCRSQQPQPASSKRSVRASMLL